MTKKMTVEQSSYAEHVSEKLRKKNEKKNEKKKGNGARCIEAQGEDSCNGPSPLC
jgi:hypothetical protein